MSVPLRRSARLQELSQVSSAPQTLLQMAEHLLKQIEGLVESRKTIKSLRIPVLLADAIDKIADYHGGEEVPVERDFCKKKEKKKKKNNTSKKTDKDRKKTKKQRNNGRRAILTKKMRRLKLFQKFAAKTKSKKRQKEMIVNKPEFYWRTYVQEYCTVTELTRYVHLVIESEKRREQGIDDQQPSYDPDQLENASRCGMMKTGSQRKRHCFRPLRVLICCYYKKGVRYRWCHLRMTMRRNKMKIRWDSRKKRNTEDYATPEEEGSAPTQVIWRIGSSRILNPISDSEIPEYRGPWCDVLSETSSRDEREVVEYDDRDDVLHEHHEWSYNQEMRDLSLSNGIPSGLGPVQHFTAAASRTSTYCIDETKRSELVSDQYVYTSSFDSPILPRGFPPVELPVVSATPSSLCPTSSQEAQHSDSLKRYQLFNSQVSVACKASAETFLKIMAALGFDNLCSDDIQLCESVSTMIAGKEKYNMVFEAKTRSLGEKLDEWIRTDEEEKRSIHWNSSAFGDDKSRYVYLMHFTSIEDNSLITLGHLVFLSLELNQGSKAEFYSFGLKVENDEGCFQWIRIPEHIASGRLRVRAALEISKISKTGRSRINHRLKERDLERF